MGRRLLSHLLITLAVSASLSVLFVFWVDGVLLDPDRLNGALRGAEVSQALSNAIPELATSSDDMDAGEKEEIRAKISEVVTPDYIDKKIETISYSTIQFLREGEPEPVVDISDFPDKLRAAGVDVGEDMEKEFGKPIQLNEDGKLNKVPEAYQKFKTAKWVALMLVVVLFVAEWFVAAKGEKLKRFGRIFLHLSIWLFITYIAIVILPNAYAPKLTGGIEQESMRNLVTSVISAVQGLLSVYVLASAVVCAVVALGLYAARRFKRPAVPAKAGMNSTVGRQV